MSFLKLQGNERSIAFASLVTLVISAAYIFLRTGINSISQNGLILIGAAAIMSLIAMRGRGGLSQIFAIGGLTLSMLILLNVIFGYYFGLSVVG